MRTALLALVLAACGPAATQPAPPVTPTTSAPPVAEVQPKAMPMAPKHPWPDTRTEQHVEKIGAHEVKDPYQWLEAEQAAEVQRWMSDQDAYARGELAKLDDREALARRLKELFYYDAISAPLHRGGKFFYTRKHADKEKTIVYWKQGEKGDEKVLFDPNGWSEDGSKGLGGWYPSYDGARVAYAVKEHNSDESTLHVIELATMKDTPDVLEGTKYSGASWTPDGKGFYYTYVPPVSDKVAVADRPGFAEVRYHALGTKQDKDPVVREATHNAQTFQSGGISRDGHWLISSISHGWNSTDVYFKDARVKDAPWQTLVAGVEATFAVDIWRDVFYVTTNDGAPKYKVYAVDPKHPARASWKEIVAESDATLEHAVVVGEHLVLTYLRNASSEIAVHDLGGKLVHKVALPGLGTSSGISGNEDEDVGYISFSSFTEPNIIYKTSIKSGKVEEWARVKLPIETREYTTDQVFYPSKDGTKISMFIIHKKGVEMNGKNPTILYGYGGFNVNMTPGFSGSRIVWLEKGGVYAIPNLRGGGEYGEDWHRSGMLLKKQNVFDDFIGAAEYLVKEKWTSPEHLAISGGSNGGLLTGATLTQRPDLFRAVICAVPLLDMLRYDRFGSGKTWVPEYGAAGADPAQAEVLWGYSPYRRAVDEGPRKYPAVLFDSADHDDRVDPMHARKMAATLQANQTREDSPVLLRIERNAGHGGADMVKQQVDRVADQLAFLLHYLR